VPIGPVAPVEMRAKDGTDDCAATAITVDIRIIQVLLGHAKLENTAFYTKVATRTVRTVTSPLDKLGMFKTGEIAPAG
jgi:hypothetical protein